MLKRRQPRGISGGGIVADSSPHPKLLVKLAISASPQGGGDLRDEGGAFD